MKHERNPTLYLFFPQCSVSRTLLFFQNCFCSFIIYRYDDWIHACKIEQHCTGSLCEAGSLDLYFCNILHQIMLKMFYHHLPKCLWRLSVFCCNCLFRGFCHWRIQFVQKNCFGKKKCIYVCNTSVQKTWCQLLEPFSTAYIFLITATPHPFCVPPSFPVYIMHTVSTQVYSLCRKNCFEKEKHPILKRYLRITTSVQKNWCQLLKTFFHCSHLLANCHPTPSPFLCSTLTPCIHYAHCLLNPQWKRIFPHLRE